MCLLLATDPLSYSSNNSKPWITPDQEATRWPDQSYSSDADTERDSAGHTGESPSTSASCDGQGAQTTQADSATTRVQVIDDTSPSLGNSS